MDKKALLLERLRQRSESSLASGGDGFIFPSMLAFDIGLNTRTIREILNSAVRDGTLEKMERGVGRSHKYRTIQ
ncbi:hypothetical protein ACVCCZ_003959 [Enterobacter hormaechei]|jgi:hypothetical protein|uniref:hypothetical protein n=1 Tax=Enterobacteriaceae TaxID=543 RepID=UPI00079B4D49|nr:MULTISPECIES: hypothetical protein [Enterobacter]MCU2759991.1 hypothetical protein [Enterobacter hormaechei subsp. steigerwaltii]QLU74756.1 hypothetical protein HV217_25675 [Enterobacter cloacae]HBV8894598.1 hypothetical protein [Klebsiella pneumoniae]HDS4389474.1 hypothetical protein [Enterobacter roggenkampii]HDZ1816698.1 hypothetical protein [Vibrio cholerae]HED2316035.1 hypothetical protein [Enterobacter hormaechei subsp. hoffmannii]HED3982033.1 hypothetical protein [Enterobacter horm